MGSRREAPWWSAQDILNKLRLRLLRERDVQPLKEKLGQNDFGSGLYAILMQASTALTQDHAVEEVNDWLEMQVALANPIVLAQLRRYLLPLLREEKELATPPRTSLSGVMDAVPSHVSLPGTREIASSRASLPGYRDAIPSRASLSGVRDAVPSRTSLSEYRGAETSRVSLPAHREARPSRVSLSGVRDAVPSRASLPGVREAVPSYSSLSGTHRPAASQPALHASRENSAIAARSHSRSMPSMSDRHASLAALRRAAPSIDRIPTAVEGVRKSITDMPAVVSSLQDTNEQPVPHQQIRARQTLRAPDSMDRMTSPYSVSSTLPASWAPAARTSDDVADSSDSVESEELATWWETDAILESLRLRLERYPKDSSLHGLFQTEQPYQLLSRILRAAEVLSTLEEAVAHVSKELKALLPMIPRLADTEELWEVLRPLLVLRQESCASLASLPMPSRILQQIEEEERAWLAKRKAQVEGEEEISSEDELWDWENHDGELKEFLSGAVSQIVEASGSQKALPAAEESPEPAAPADLPKRNSLDKEDKNG